MSTTRRSKKIKPINPEEQASTTPVSDTTASDTDPGETQSKQSETDADVVQMEESAPT